MTSITTKREFALSLLAEVAPQELEFAEAYEVAIDTASSNHRVGTGFGLPPDLAGALGVAAILVGRVVFEKLGSDLINPLVFGPIH